MKKENIEKIPCIGKCCINLYRWLKGVSPFTTSNEYWEKRYKKGGNSGAGSYNNLAEFKGEIVNDFVVKNNIETVIEFGCGDGNQLKYFQLKSYTGFDVSETAIARCTSLYKEDSSKHFQLLNNHKDENADLVMSLDVIYHLVENETFEKYMEKVFSSSKKFVIVYSSNFDDGEERKAPHVRHRMFTNWVEENAKNFKLIKHIPNKYPFDGNGERTSLADFYIFEKEQ